MAKVGGTRGLKVALICGAQDYEPGSGITPLGGARNDALALGRALREGCGFDRVTVLAGEKGSVPGSDGRATKRAIREALRELQECADGRIELLFLAISAHGKPLKVGGMERFFLYPESFSSDWPACRRRPGMVPYWA